LETPPSIGFDQARLLSNIMGLLVGGVETTSAAAVQAIDVLLDRPGPLAQAITAAKLNDLATFDRLFWEALRFWPMNPFIVRQSVAAYTIAAGTERETTLPANSLVLCATASAMHDATVVKNPEAFDPNRPAYHYLHFGYGEHVCLGDQVSLQQTPELARQVFLAGYTKRAEGPAGRPDFKGGSFPESLTLVRG
jgi:cytochrome P450